MLSPSALSASRLAAALLLVAIAAHAMGVFGDGATTLKSPYPLPLTILAFVGVPVSLLAILFGGLFYFTCRRASVDKPRLPKGAAVALSVATIASVGHFVASWSYGVEYQGKAFLYSCVCINAIAVLGLFSIWVLNHRSAMPLSAVAFYFALFAWLGTYAFPYLGEGP
jgi:hypothetical protein